jgi:hypothetical protein
MPRSTRKIILVIAGLCLIHRFVTEGAFAYIIADWRRITFVLVVALLGTAVVVIARSQAPHMTQPTHNPVFLFRFGAVAGAMIGLFETVIPSIIWHVHGELESHIRGGWVGVAISSMLCAAFGAAAGAGFGGLLLLIESRFRRELRFGRLASSMLLIIPLMFGFTYVVFPSDWDDSFLIGNCLVIAASTTAAALLSTRATVHQPPPLPPAILPGAGVQN